MSERERGRTATIARLTNKKDDGGLWVRDSGMSIQTGKIWLRFGGDDDGEARPVTRLPRRQGFRP